VAVEEKAIVIVAEEYSRAVDPAQDHVHWVAGSDDASASGHGEGRWPRMQEV